MISLSLSPETLVPPPASDSPPAHYKPSDPAAQHDSDLVRRFNEGDEKAFTEIVCRHRAKLLSQAMGHMRNRADAEEIAQDACLHAYRGLARFRGESSLASWLYRIVFNLSRNRCGYYLRRHRQDTCSLSALVGQEGQATIADLIACDNPDPARQTTHREFLDLVESCMAKLTPRQREILAMRNTVGHSYDEIARILRISPGTVKSRLARARECLRSMLRRVDDEPKNEALAPLYWFRNARQSGHLTVVTS